MSIAFFLKLDNNYSQPINSVLCTCRSMMASSTSSNRTKRKSNDISPPPLKRKVLSTTTSATVANFFKPVSAKEPNRVKWRIVNKSLIVAKYNSTSSAAVNHFAPRRIASFDLDSTLIKTISGRIFAKSESDWTWWDSAVPKKLKELYSQGYNVIIFTNQGGINVEKPAGKLDKFKLKVAAIFETLDIPVTLYGATENDQYRKPKTGMWDELIDEYDLDVHGVDKAESFLVGDAAGRDGDFSATDKHFANNVGIKFYTPEEFFLGHEPKPMKDEFNPMTYVTTGAPEPTSSRAPKFTKLNDVELVVLVGSPGAGKSSFAKRYLCPLGYERVNQDTSKSRDKCMKVATEFLEGKKSVVIDNTNADVETRKLWIGLAKKLSIPIRCIHLTTPLHVCQHNDAVQAFGGDIVNPEQQKALPKIAFSGYKSRFVEPQLDEGFVDITKIDFQWKGSDAERAI
ncbi:polynucleotide kinase 3 phosphatase-domain-containing protein [Kalaharituber pfeilii]|nr:polynucleotide kinase 3 phosphatase-domain-containing protein [Kalaharituber pfeilii]